MKRNLLGPLAAEVELRKEQVSAIARIGHKLDALIRELGELRDPLAHQKKREEAKKYYWYMMVQREALGIRNHDELPRHYRIPDPI